MSAMPELFKCPIVPVLTIDAAEQAVPLAETLQKAGFSALEMTFSQICSRRYCRHAQSLPRYEYRRRHDYRPTI